MPTQIDQAASKGDEEGLGEELRRCQKTAADDERGAGEELIAARKRP